jgi:hypothetical protein
MINDLAKYESVKDQMKTGDLLQWSTNGIVGEGIRLFTHSEFSHSSLVLRLQEYEGLERRRFTTEATRKGVVLNLLSNRLQGENGRVWWYPLKEDWDCKRQDIGEKALLNIGKSYAFGNAAKFLIGKVSEDMNKMFCSQLCYVAYGFGGVPPSPGEMLDLGIFKEGMEII